MKYINLSKKSDSHFQRKTGVKRPTFLKMVEIVNNSIKNRKTKRGNDSKLSVEDQILIMLQYYREYPTLFLINTTINAKYTKALKLGELKDLASEFESG